MLDKLISYIILPAQIPGMVCYDYSNLSPKELNKKLDELTRRRTHCKDHNTTTETKDIRTEDGYWIRAYKITPANFDPTTIPDKKIGAHIFFNPNAVFAEHQLDHLRELANRTGIPVYTCNYRGVGTSELLNQRQGHSSTPCNLNTLRQDGLALFNFALSDNKEHGLTSGQIEVRGHSLGGVVAGETVHALRPYIDLDTCPYLTTQQTLHTFTSFVLAHLIFSRSHYRYGYLHPSFLVFDNPLLNLIELFVFKPVLLALAVAAFCIIKPILYLTGLETNNGYNFISHPREKRRNLYTRTPEAVRLRDGVSLVGHIDDKIIKPFAALNNAWRVDFTQRYRASQDQKEQDRFDANKFYNRNSKEHEIQSLGHFAVAELTNRFAHDINASIADHINTLNGKTNKNPRDYYYTDCDATLKKIEETERRSLPTKPGMNLNQFLQQADLTDTNKARIRIDKINTVTSEFANSTAPANLATIILNEIQGILTYATTHTFILSLYKQLLLASSIEDSTFKSVLHDRRSGLFSSDSRFKASLLTEEDLQTPFATTRTFALIQQAFYDRLTEIDGGKVGVTRELEDTWQALQTDYGYNSDYLGRFFSTMSWCLFGESNKQRQAVVCETAAKPTSSLTKIIPPA